MKNLNSKNADFENVSTDNLSFNSINSDSPQSVNDVLAWNGSSWEVKAAADLGTGGLSYNEVIVTVSGGKFYIDGTQQLQLSLQRGLSYRFNQSDNTNSGHPIKFSTLSDGTHNTPGGSEYTAGIVYSGTPGSAGAYTEVTLSQSSPNLYYYCANHSGMGGSALGEITLKADGNVGIGTTILGVGRRLTVAGGAIAVSGQNTTHSASSLVLGQDSTAISQIRFYGADTSTAGVLQFTGSSSDSSVGEERMRIDSNGNVGIGTTIPNTSLHVTSPAGNGYGTVFIENTLGDYGMGLRVKGGGNVDNERFALSVQNAAGDDILFAQSKTGNVGIGTTNPVHKLQIDAGTLYAATRSVVDNFSWDMGVAGSTASNADLRGKFYMWDATNSQVRFVIDSTGNVGIGTASPGNILHIYDGAAGSAGTLADPDWSDSLFLQRIIPNNYQGTRILFAHGKASIGGFREDNTADGSHHLVFYTGSNTAGVSEAMRINSAGKVGIGTTNPQEPLHVNGNLRTEGNLMLNPGGNTPYVIGGQISTVFRNNSNNASILTILDTGSIGIGTSDPGSYKLNVMNSNTDFAQKISNSNSTSAYCLYLAMPAGHDNKTSEYMRCATNGNINFTVYSDGTISADGMSLGSDDRIKHNEEEIVNAVEALSKITPKKYFKTTKLYDANHDFDLDSDGNPIDESGEPVKHRVEAGVIAQEVLGVDELKFAVSPEIKDEDGNVTSPYTLNYNSLFTYAIAAIQEQQQLIEDLKSRIETLES